MDKRRRYYYLIPEKLIDKLPEIDEFMRNAPGYNVDYLKEVISLVAYHIRKNKDDSLKKNMDNWAHLKIEYLRRYVPQADLYINDLIGYGVIESPFSYKKSVWARGYRFTSAYQSKYVSFEVVNPKLIKRIKAAQRSFKNQNSKKYPDQNKYIKQLTIEPEAFKYIEINYSDKIDKFNYAYASATRIMNHDIYYTVDTTAGRYHSNLTNMPKGLRQFARILNIPLKSVDVKNCQPYLSILFFENPKKISEFARYKPFARLLQNLQIQKTEDVKKYISLVSEGQLYEYLIAEFEKKGYNFKTCDYGKKRDKIKNLVLKILFDRNIHMPRYRKIFMELFPEVHRIFAIIRGNERGNKFKSYQRFAILLQKIESHIVLNIILTRIYREHQGIIAVTVHDSIMTGNIYTDHAQIVHKIMEEEFTKFVGHKPTLKEE